MERLNHIIKDVVDSEWILIQLSFEGPLLAHLFFGDDLVLFEEVLEIRAKRMLYHVIYQNTGIE